jgi:hypothetical protein
VNILHGVEDGEVLIADPEVDLLVKLGDAAGADQPSFAAQAYLVVEYHEPARENNIILVTSPVYDNNIVPRQLDLRKVVPIVHIGYMSVYGKLVVIDGEFVVLGHEIEVLEGRLRPVVVAMDDPSVICVTIGMEVVEFED